MGISSAVEHGSNSLVAGRLYEAALSGSVDSLDMLLEQYGKAAISRFSLTSFAETPLHLSALKGHLEFSMRLLELNPELASETDAEKCTPLHLAAANGHDKVVKVLLKTYEKACLVQDQEGRLPLHLAAMRGRISVLRELLNSKLVKESLKMKVGDGDGILHLCVKYNHLDVLKILLTSVGDDDDGMLLKMTDCRGNTALHLAVILKQLETVKFMLGLPWARARIINALNHMGLTPLDALNNLSLLDYKSLQIREILVVSYGMEAIQQIETARFLVELPGVRTGTDNFTPLGSKIPVIPEILLAGPEAETETETVIGRGWRLVLEGLERLRNYEGNWMEDTRGWLMGVSALIATVTFAAAISPPGGVWSNDVLKSAPQACDANGSNCFYPCDNDTDYTCWAGTAVLSYYYDYEFVRFMEYNTVSFVSSLMVVFLLLSGFPLSNKFTLWILSLAMCLTVSFLGLTFLQAMWLVLPDHLIDQYNTFKKVSKAVWFTMVGLVGISLLIRLSYWVKRHSLKVAFTSCLSPRPKKANERRHKCPDV